MARLPLNGLLLLVALGACDPGSGTAQIEVVRILPHDARAYTQGFVFHEGRLFESTGQYGESALREVDPETGAVLREVSVAPEYFAEGLAAVGDRLIQLTWREGIAFVYDIDTFQVVETLRYDGDGWGLCYDGSFLWMTTGGSILYRRDPRSFEVLETRQILMGGPSGPSVSELNELECVGEYIYANKYQDNRLIYKVEKATGHVVGTIDTSGLVPEGGMPRDVGAVLNGIAYDPARNLFLLTGKLWPSAFEVRFLEGGR